MHIRTLRAFPTSEGIMADELASILSRVEGFGAAFRAGFVPNPMQKALHDAYWNCTDDRMLVVLVTGGTGSGKSMGAMSLIMDLLARFPGTRALAVRHTYDELMDSVFEAMGEFLDLYGFGHTSRKDPPGFYFPNDSRMLLRSERSTMKTSDKGAKASSLGSTQYSVVWFEEADGISERFYTTVVTRMRQASLPRPLVIMVCNPPTEDHWLYRKFWVDCPDDAHHLRLHFPIEDNAAHLRQGYIEDLERELAPYPTLYKKFRLGLPGPDARGRPIFAGLFHKHVHVAPEPLEFDDEFPLWRAWDFGWRRPAVVIAQDDTDTGQLRILYTKMGHQTLLKPFAERELNVHKQLFPGARWNEVCDVEGRKRNPYTDKSQHDILRGLGLEVKSSYSLVEYGLNLWQDLLATTLPGGLPAFLIDPARCGILVDGLDFGYCQDEGARKGDELRPVSDGYYEHCMDCVRYILVQTREIQARKVPKPKDRTMYRPFEEGSYTTMTADEYFRRFRGRNKQIARYNFGRRKGG